jgi:putative pyoverdin transport system ATP-binding/permease protein
MKIINFLIKKSGKSILITATTSFLSGVSSAGIIAIVNYSLTNLNNLPYWLPWLFFSLCLTLLLFQFISWVRISRLSQQIIYDLRLELSDGILACPLQYLEQVGAPKQLATLTGDINTIATASSQISVVIVNIAILICTSFYLYWLSPVLSIVLLACLLGGISLYKYLQKPGIRELERYRASQDILFGHFRDITQGVKELKINKDRRSTFLDRDLRSSATKSKYHYNKAMTNFALAGSTGTILFFIPIGFILFILPNVCAVTTSLVSSCIFAILYLISPISSIITALPTIIQANVALNKIESLGFLLFEKKTESNYLDNSSFGKDWLNLELVNINHTYGNNTEIRQFNLGEINLNFQRNEITFIIGGNGSGKSTLAKLITGLYIPDRGNIYIDNQEVTDRNRDWYRQLFSVVFYDFYLFERLLGVTNDDSPEIQDYLTRLELESKVTINNGTLSTIDLSQGQRRRLALLTAYLEDRPIYLFDEWASDQDPIFKEVFYKMLLPELKEKGKTIIVVSHDNHYFEYADRVVKLDCGKIEYVKNTSIK